MKAAITDGKGNLWIGDAPIPEPNDYQCLCKIDACATCVGTDQKHIHNKVPWEQKYPGILGHESVGTIIGIGSKVRNIRIGDRYLRPAAIYPGEKLGNFYSMWGGFAEYGLITDTVALKKDQPDFSLNNYTRFQQQLPADCKITAADATMLITLKEAASYVASGGISLYKSVLILGAGSVAISMLRFAKIFGAYPVIMVARREEQLACSRKIGADFTINTEQENLVKQVMGLTGNKGVDFIIDTTGNVSIVKQAMEALAPEGKAALYATYERGENAAEIIGESRVAPAATGEDIIHQYLLDAVRLSLLDLKQFYSHTLPLAEIKEGFEMLKKKEAYKIVFTI